MGGPTRAPAAPMKTQTSSCAALPPVVQHRQFVFNRNTRGFEIGDGTYDLMVLHVTCGVVVTANHKNTGMTAARGVDKEMKHAVVVMIACQKDKGLLNGVQQVFWVVGAAQTNGGWDDHLMTRLAQKRCQQSLRAVVVKVEVHGRGW